MNFETNRTSGRTHNSFLLFSLLFSSCRISLFNLLSHICIKWYIIVGHMLCYMTICVHKCRNYTFSSRSFTTIYILNGNEFFRVTVCHHAKKLLFRIKDQGLDSPNKKIQILKNTVWAVNIRFRHLEDFYGNTAVIGLETLSYDDNIRPKSYDHYWSFLVRIGFWRKIRNDIFG